MGSKTPAIASFEDVDYLLNRVPDLRTIYIVRNIADVIQSSMRRRDAAATSGESWILATEQEAIDEWLYSLFMCRYLRERGQVLVLKYEDIVSNQAASAREISDFLGISRFNFTINEEFSKRIHGNLQEFGYSRYLWDLIKRWPELSVDEICSCNLPDFDRLAAGWRNLGLPLCDLGTQVNFHGPERCGSWSKPGFSS